MKLHLRTDFSGLLYLVIIALGLAGWSSCENSDELGLELTDESERFTYYTDSSTLVSMSTLRQDSLTSEKRSAVLLGQMQDPVFGESNAGFLTQLRLSSNDVAFGENVQVDSVVLILKYLSYYGDTTSLQNIRVFEMMDDLAYDSTYYSNLDLSTYYDENQVIGEHSYMPEPSLDSLAIQLDHSLGYKILESDTSHLSSNASFLEHFKGLYLKATVESGSGAMVYFNLTGSKSKMSLYYSNSEKDSLSYDVLINTNCSWVNVFDHNYAGTEVEAQISDTLRGEEFVYVQAMAGLRAGVELTFSDSLLSKIDQGIAINQAKLIFPVADQHIDEQYSKPDVVSIFAAKADGTNEFIEDILLGSSYHGGGYSDTERGYVFNVSLHVQRLLDPDIDKRIENTGLFLVVGEARTTASRVVLKNAIGTEKPKLAITYTILD